LDFTKNWFYKTHFKSLYQTYQTWKDTTRPLPAATEEQARANSSFSSVPEVYLNEVFYGAG